MAKSASPPKKPRLLWFVGTAYTLVYFVLMGTAGFISTRPVSGTEGLIAQVNLLMAGFQGLLGLTIALATVFYAVRTNDLVVATQTAESTARVERIEAASHELIGAALRALGPAAFVSELRKPHRIWRLAGGGATRDRELLSQATRLQEHVSAVARWAHEVSHREPLLQTTAGEVTTAVLDLHQAAVTGDSSLLHGSIEQLNQAISDHRRQWAALALREPGSETVGQIGHTEQTASVI